MYLRSFSFLACLICCATVVTAQEPTARRRIVLMAGRPSHPPGQHEFNAGVQLLAKCLAGVPQVKAEVVLNGWPEDEKLLEQADAILFYMDGRGGHELVKQNGRRLELVQKLVDKGVGIGCLHYGVDVVPAQAGPQLQQWIGGYYENNISVNPLWEPKFESFPDHPITRGVQPFQIQDEWYFNIRFAGGGPGNAPGMLGDLKFTPLLLAAPSADVRDGPYVAPRGPFPHIVEAANRPEAMMWVVERPSGGRGLGFTGGHFHTNWGNDNFRKLVLNSFLWLAKVDVPANGVESQVSSEELKQNLDEKRR